MSTLTRQTLSHLDWLEAEAIHILREVAGQCANPVLLFSGGKDSICLLRLAEKAFRPGRFPFPLMHIDTGHNYREVTEFRDRRAAELGERLIVRSVEDSMARGTVVLKQPNESRNKHQSVTLLEAIALWEGAPVRAALVVDDGSMSSPSTSLYRDTFALFGEQTPLYRLEWVPQSGAARRRRDGLTGLGDFADLERLLARTVAR